MLISPLVKPLLDLMSNVPLGETMREIGNHFDTLYSVSPEKLAVNTEVIVITNDGSVYLFEKGSQINILYLKAACLDSPRPFHHRRICTTAITKGELWVTTDVSGSDWRIDVSAIFRAKQSPPVLPLSTTLEVINREYGCSLLALNMLSNAR